MNHPVRSCCRAVVLACLSLVFHSGLLVTPVAASPLITEFMADNESTLADEDGAYSDWIEIHNPDAVPVNLDGYFLTDSAASLAKWRIPAVTVSPGGFLVVFASGKDRAVAGSELHTNFKLGAGGEYLALVAPDGETVLGDFPPQAQDPDRSHGVAFEGAPLVTEGAAARILVPSNGTLGTGWTQPGFNPSGWFSGPTGVGFGLRVPGITIEEAKATVTIQNLATAVSVLDGANQSTSTTAVRPVVNFLGDGGDGRFGDNLLFPNGGGDDFALRATGVIVVEAAGTWTFGINSDDGARLRIDGTNVINDDNLHGPVDTFGSRFLSAGEHAFELIFFERGGGDEVELFAAPGTHTSFNAEFRLVGDTANGGLPALTDPVGGGGGSIGTDLAGAMLGVNAGAYVRIPFEVADVAAIDSLSLEMRYNDGFVAYINGTPVASSNAPGTPAWNSAATASRGGAESLVPVAFNATAALGSLVAGTNVLAIHGLNAGASDDSFLVLPELRGGGLGAGPPVYFDDPTPGAINAEASSLGKVADTRFFPDRGFYPNAAFPTAPIQVEITTATDGAVIRYTTDGSAPSESHGTVYTGPITVANTTTLRAVATKPGFDPTNVDTHTYLILDDVIRQSETAPAGWPSGSVNGQVFDYGMDPTIVDHGDPAIGGPAQVAAALSAIPSISVVTDQPNLTDPATGIYTHAGNRGFAWERPASVELLLPEGFVDPDGNTKGFQVDAGLRIRGGFSRSGNNPKHALRLFFRAEYGDPKLEYPLFGRDGAQEFDNLDLRTSQNYSWAFQNDSRNTFLREVFSRDTQRDMGQPHTRSRYYHVYLNGVYWGLYMTQERSEASYAASYFGGSKDNYDTVKAAGSSGGYTTEMTDGTFDAWQALWRMGRNLVDPGFAGDRAAEFFRMQGLDPDGTRNPAYPVLLDLDNFIDYMIVTFWVGNFDAPLSNFLGNDRPNNWFGIRDRSRDDMGFVFFAHDAEHSLFPGWDRTGPFNSGNRANLSYSNPQFLHEDLLQNLDPASRREYLIRFADRAQKWMFNDGALTTDRAAARIEERAAVVDRAIIAESARWGDSKRADPFTRATWISARNDLLNNYLPTRNAQVLSQFRGDALYPATDAPVFSRHGGYVSSGTPIAMSSPDGTIYYTVADGDPRVIGGTISSSAAIFQGSSTNVTLVESKSSWRYLDDGSNQGTAWRQPGFDDGAWSVGNAELGYGDSQDTEISFGGNASAKHVTTWFRKTFTASEVASLDSLTLELQRDDGAVVYLNGVEIARHNLPAGPIDFQTTALSAVGGADEETFFPESVDPGLLVEGANVLAVELHQVSPTSSDVSFDLRLRGSSTTSSNPLLLPGPGEVVVQARALDAGDWSALNAATFYVDLTPPSLANLAVSEIHYRPAAPTAAELVAGFNDRDDFEFIELLNTSPTEHVHLRDLAFIDGIDFNFSDSVLGVVLAPGERVVIVKNRAAFEFRYGIGHPVAGEFAGNLNNDGESLTLVDAAGATVHSFAYNDAGAWPENADGDGFSLVLIDPASNPDPADPANWRHSADPGGAPGTSDAGAGYAAWKAANGVGSDDEDDDADGRDAIAEYVVGGDPGAPDVERDPAGSVETLEVGGVAGDYLVVRVPRRAGADDAAVVVEVGDSLDAWDLDAGDRAVYHGVRKNGDGSETLVFRSAAPLGGAPRLFFRVRFVVAQP